MELKKQLARHDADFAINPGNNHETSIKLPADIVSLFIDVESAYNKDKHNVKFFIHKEDFLKSACGIIGSLPLLDKHGHQVSFSCNFCENLLGPINDFFGDNDVKEYGAELLFYTDRSSCIQGFDKAFNIRSYTVEQWSTISFIKKADGIHMRLFFSRNKGKESDNSTVPYGSNGTSTSVGIVSDISQEYVANSSHEVYTKNNFLEEVFMEEEQYNEILELLERKKNIILQGAPGVGKTFAAKRLVYSILGCKDESKVEFIQFHQSYAYEDFVLGYKPTETGFAIEEGPFYKFCKKAEANGGKHFFIIDEINRGNLSRIFGELLVLTEATKRNESATLLYTKESFKVPDNVYIIGMMNTADRSLAMIDYALRRRFSFFPMEPAFSLDSFKSYLDKIAAPKAKVLVAKIIELNNEIESDDNLGKGFKIGHSYLCAEDLSDESLKAIVQYEIIPLLEEYWYDEPSKVEKWSQELLSALK